MASRTHAEPAGVQVALDLQASNPDAAIDILGHLLTDRLGPGLLAQVLPAVGEREAQASTFLGHGTALPHTRFEGDAPWLVSFGRFSPPVVWGSNGEAARFVFLTLIPREAIAAYLGFVRDLGRAVRDKKVRRELEEVRDETAVRAWLRCHLGVG